MRSPPLCARPADFPVVGRKPRSAAIMNAHQARTQRRPKRMRAHVGASAAARYGVPQLPTGTATTMTPNATRDRAGADEVATTAGANRPVRTRSERRNTRSCPVHGRRERGHCDSGKGARGEVIAPLRLPSGGHVELQPVFLHTGSITYRASVVRLRHAGLDVVMQRECITGR